MLSEHPGEQASLLNVEIGEGGGGSTKISLDRLVLRVTHADLLRSTTSISFLKGDPLSTRAVQQFLFHLSACVIINKQIRFHLCLFAVTN